MSWRNIWRNRKRTYITLSSIAFAVLLSCIMRSMQLGSYERMISNALSFYSGHAQIHKQGYWDDKSLDNGFADFESIEEKIADIEGLETIIPRIESFALASYEVQTKGAMVLGIIPEREDQLTRLKDKIVEGAFLENEDRSVLVAEGLAKYLKIGVGDSLVLLGQGYHGANAAGIYPVKGIIKFPIGTQNNQMVYLPLKEAQWLYAFDGMVTNFTLKLEDANDALAICGEINSKLSGTELEAVDWKFMLPELLQGIELDNISGKIMLSLLYLVIGFGMFGTFLMMTRERMFEFGLMLAVGFKKVKMQIMIFMEFLYLCFLGVFSGVILSLPIIIYFYFNPIYITNEGTDVFEKFGMEPVYAFSMDPSIFYGQAWVVFIMTILLGFYPLLVIHRLKIIKAMRP